ncbi:MAG: hypothetical protein Fur0035_21860 [Anaerolineales bacterium]
MRDWTLGNGDPLHLTLACDARLTPPDYANDHTWQLDLGGGEPAALGLRSSYGLRARLMRLFPRFVESGRAIHDPEKFISPPRVKRFYPNFLEVNFSPLSGLKVNAEYWAPASQIVAGRLTLLNQGVTPLQFSLEWVAQLSPLEGQSMTAAQRQSVSVLEGRSGNLAPVLFLSGGAQPGGGPYPSLALALDLPAGASRQFTWALASLGDAQESFEAARRASARPWEAERARLERLNESQSVEIFTGDLDWDAALALSQRAAFGLLLGNSPQLPNPSFCLVRQPDSGYSPAGDGSDHQRFWNGQSAPEAYWLNSLLPGAPEIGRGLLENFLAVQEQDGAIDAKPGLAGQRARVLAAPLLASLAWQMYQRQPDPQFLQKNYPALQKFFWAWFSPARDQDRNGLPEWQNVAQSGFDDNPLFDGWHEWAQGIDISTVQSPALAAMLYREAISLIQMAELAGRAADAALLRRQAEILKQGALACWDDDGAFYRYADRDTHLSPSGKILSDRQASASLDLQKEFKEPVRLVLRIHGQDEALKRPRVSISGKLNGAEQNETLDWHAFRFSASGAVATSQKVFDSLGHFEFDGLNRKDRITLQSVDLSIPDHTLLLPLWAKIPDERAARNLLYRTLLDAERFDHPFGIPALPRAFVPEADPLCMSVHLPWNALIAEGMLAYGYRREAARLMAHLMSAVIQNLKRGQTFHRAYHAESGAGLGERDSLYGLAPLGLFLQILGVEIFSPEKVALRGKNPFPWPVTVKYRGLTVQRLNGHSEIIFPSGQSAQVADPANTLICMR